MKGLRDYRSRVCCDVKGLCAYEDGLLLADVMGMILLSHLVSFYLAGGTRGTTSSARYRLLSFTFAQDESRLKVELPSTLTLVILESPRPLNP